MWSNSRKLVISRVSRVATDGTSAWAHPANTSASRNRLLLLGRPGLLADTPQPGRRVLDPRGQGDQHGRDPVAQGPVLLLGAHRHRHHAHQRSLRLLLPGGEEGAQGPRRHRQHHIVGGPAEHVADPPHAGQGKLGQRHPPVGRDGPVDRRAGSVEGGRWQRLRAPPGCGRSGPGPSERFSTPSAPARRRGPGSEPSTFRHCSTSPGSGSGVHRGSSRSGRFLGPPVRGRRPGTVRRAGPGPAPGTGRRTPP